MSRDDLREIDDHRARMEALGRLIGPREERTDLAPVVSLAELRARRAGHPSAWRGEPVSARPRAAVRSFPRR